MFKPVEPNPDFAKLEEEVLKFWEKEKIFEKSLEQTKNGKPFVFYEGPPTANAAPGIHHVEARAFKDLIPRFETMRGRYVARKAGWDTHGLPVELQIEKKLGISGKKQIESLKPTVRESVAYFNQLCRESVWQFKEEWEKLTRRMGYWIDLAAPYVTYENSYIEKVWGILKQIWEKGLIYQGHKVVPYCPRCGTALSSHEVAQGYDRVEENSVYVKFKVKDQPDTYFLSWTTTPWTLPGNVALAVGKDVNYAKVKLNGEYLIVAKERLSVILEGAGRPIGSQDSIASPARSAGWLQNDKVFTGKDLVGLEYEPLFDIPRLRQGSGGQAAYKVYAADFVNTEEGTGIVHTAVMYGEDDYELGSAVGLPKHHTVDEEGKFTDDLAAYGLAGAGVKAKETEKKIIDFLRSKNLLLREERYAHDYPFCWRCNHPLLYYARNSWFIKMSALRDELVKNNETINWIPEYIKEGRFGEWLREVKDWAISRERYWGTPLPFWKCEKCGEIEVVGELDGAADDLHRPYVDDIKLKCKKCGGESARVPEVLDVWFDSGAMPFAQGAGGYPADYISEAIDQTRGWFYTLLAISTLLAKGASYRNVVCLGHVLDEKGEKMSKSKGNIVNPWDIGNKYGFDIMRWYFYSVNQPGDGKLFAESELLRMQRRVQKILWNVYNYFVTYANAAGWTPATSFACQEQEVPPLNLPLTKGEKEGVLDRWQNARLQELINSVTASLDNFDAFHAARDIGIFIDDLSTWYLRRSRGRSDKAFFTTLFRTLMYLSKILAPFMPFLAEEIYRNLDTPPSSPPNIGGEGRGISVHLSKWPTVEKLTAEQEQLLAQMREMRNIATEAHALRAAAGIKLRQPLQKLVVDSRLRGNDGVFLEILKQEINVREIVFGDKLELDTTITPALKQEGRVRELARQIQGLRKEMGLKIGELAAVEYRTDSDDLKTVMEKIDRGKIYASSIRAVSSLTEGKEIEVDGEKCTINIRALS